MIESVLKDVREAESRAEQLQKDAYQRGKEIVLKAEAEAEAQKKATVKECKADRQRELADARAAADDKAQSIIRRGAEEAEAFEEARNSSVEDFADRIVAMLFEKYAPSAAGADAE